jgi:hypothetical protein
VSIRPKAAPRLTCYLPIAGSSLCESIIQDVIKIVTYILWGISFCWRKKQTVSFLYGWGEVVKHLHSLNWVFVSNSRARYGCFVAKFQPPWLSSFPIHTA